MLAFGGELLLHPDALLLFAPFVQQTLALLPLQLFLVHSLGIRPDSLVLPLRRLEQDAVPRLRVPVIAKDVLQHGSLRTTRGPVTGRPA